MGHCDGVWDTQDVCRWWWWQYRARESKSKPRNMKLLSKENALLLPPCWQRVAETTLPQVVDCCGSFCVFSSGVWLRKRRSMLARPWAASALATTTSLFTDYLEKTMTSTEQVRLTLHCHEHPPGRGPAGWMAMLDTNILAFWGLPVRSIHRPPSQTPFHQPFDFVLSKSVHPSKHWPCSWVRADPQTVSPPRQRGQCNDSNF